MESNNKDNEYAAFGGSVVNMEVSIEAINTFNQQAIDRQHLKEAAELLLGDAGKLSAKNLLPCMAGTLLYMAEEFDHSYGTDLLPKEINLEQLSLDGRLFASTVNTLVTELLNP